MENYEKAYKEALKVMEGLYNVVKYQLSSDALLTLQTLKKAFPELRESEDEKIRKGLIKGLSAMRDIHKHQTFSDDAINIDDAIAWLEKQGDRKPVEQDTEICDLWVYIREWKDKFGRLPKDEDELAACIDYVMKRQKPAEWSEEDEKLYTSALWHIKNSCGNGGKDSGEFEVYNWLKSIKDRVQPQPKQEWNEKDKANLDNIIWLCENCEKGIENTWIPSQSREIKELIKSLNPNHWKPSEEQMMTLCALCVLHKESKVLESLYNDLADWKDQHPREGIWDGKNV